MDVKSKYRWSERKISEIKKSHILVEDFVDNVVNTLRKLETIKLLSADRNLN